MKNGVQLDTKTFVRFWLIVIGFALAAMAIYSAMTGLIIIGAAVFLALALNPPVTRLVRILPGNNRVVSIALAYLTVVVTLSAFVFLVVPPILEQTAKAAQTIPGLVTGATEQYKGLGDFIETNKLQPQVDSLLVSIQDSTATFAKNIGSNLISSIGSFFAVVTSIILTLVLSFFMLIEGPALFEWLWKSYADKKKMKYHRSVLMRMYSVVTGYVTGQLSVSAIAGTVAGLVVFVLTLFFNVPVNFVLPSMAIVFLLSLIPLFGEVMGSLLIGLILAFNDVSAALLFIGFFFIYQQVEANYISPRIQSRKIELSPLVVLVSVTIGIYMFGIAGGIISIPIAGIIRILIEEYVNYRKERREAAS